LNLERRYCETNHRSLEIDQPFSLGQVAPAALLTLRETGSCQFELPEIFFDLFYPGQYRRRVRSVRLTIPCVTGPYTNVGATLTGSRMRLQPQLGAAFLVELPPRRSVSIATTTAQADAGVFEFSFRDERYLPFEGAGALSSWTLSLPAAFHPFDYQTINDVVVHASYGAEEDGALRIAVEAQNAAIQGTIFNVLTTTPVSRSFSLRQDFSDTLQRLWHSPAGTPVRIELEGRHVPLVLRGRKLKVSRATLLLRTSPQQSVNGTAVSLNGADAGTFMRRPALGAGVAPGLVGSYTIAVSAAGDLAPSEPVAGDSSALAESKLTDVLLHVEYMMDVAP
jgi:hypothetical protein